MVKDAKSKKKTTQKKEGLFGLKLPTTVLGLMKAKKFKKIDYPDFKISKKIEKIEFPKTGKINIKYSLIGDFAFSNIKKDEKTKELTYNVTEPKMTVVEEESYNTIVGSMMEIIDVDLSSIKGTDQAVDYLEEKVREVIEELSMEISEDTFRKIMYFVYRNFIGLNEIEPFMLDPYIEDISCDGVNVPIYIVHRKYGSIKTNVIFKDNEKLKEFVVKLSERSGRFISYAEPLLDGSLPDGSRVQASFTKDITTRGPSFTIRRFVEKPLSPIDLIKNGAVNSEILAFLWMAIESGASVLIGGGAATGKTTMLNVLSSFIPWTSKIVSIEDTRELNLMHENWLPSVTRAAFSKGLGEVTMFDLLKESFRQSPDYVVVGEVRGKEAYVMFQGMAAGFPAMGTIHAGKVEDIVHRLETPPISLSPTLIDTLDIVVIMVHARDKGPGARRVKEIVEIESVDPKTGTARTNKLFSWLPSDDSFQFRGYSWLIQEISKLRGMVLEDVKREISRRKKILDYMVEKDITSFEDVAKFIFQYERDPKSVLKKIGIKEQ